MTRPTASTREGKVAGVGLDGGILAFKGMRYAEPPVGARRFLAPLPLAPFDGVFDAAELGPSCPQPRTRPSGWSHEAHEDEDCLRLNVWTPGTDDRHRPVMVFLHGGGFGIGSGSWPLYDGANLARRGDVVVVTVNHRLGPLGYLHLAAFGGPELAASGNAGMQDLLMALRWVRDNIASFGGDAGNVTLFGESGGGAKICALLAMPAARGLFHRAVIQSGPARYLMTAQQGTDTARAYLDKLGIVADERAVAALRALPAADLVTAAESLGGGLGGGARRLGLSPVLDGEVLAHQPAHALREGHAPDVPLLVGTTFDEASLWLAGEPALHDPSALSHEQLPGRLAHLGERAARLLQAYRTSRPEAPAIDLLLAINSDATMRIPSIKLVEQKLSGPGSAPVWMYLFCWSAGPLRAGHGFELPFVFDNIHEPVMHASPSRQQLAERMSNAWIAFARSGDPNHQGLPRWTAYDTEERTTMLFDRGACDVAADPWGKERAAWFS